jgi:hypothetical protein
MRTREIERLAKELHEVEKLGTGGNPTVKGLFDDEVSLCYYVSKRMNLELTIAEAEKVMAVMVKLADHEDLRRHDALGLND